MPKTLPTPHTPNPLCPTAAPFKIGLEPPDAAVAVAAPPPEVVDDNRLCVVGPAVAGGVVVLLKEKGGAVGVLVGRTALVVEDVPVPTEVLLGERLRGVTLILDIEHSLLKSSIIVCASAFSLGLISMKQFKQSSRFWPFPLVHKQEADADAHVLIVSAIGVQIAWHCGGNAFGLIGSLWRTRRALGTAKLRAARVVA